MVFECVEARDAVEVIEEKGKGTQRERERERNPRAEEMEGGSQRGGECWGHWDRENSLGALRSTLKGRIKSRDTRYAYSE
jgi:hypothetical protein